MSTDKLTKSVKEEPDKSDKAFTIRSVVFVIPTFIRVSVYELGSTEFQKKTNVVTYTAASGDVLRSQNIAKDQRSRVHLPAAGLWPSRKWSYPLRTFSK